MAEEQAKNPENFETPAGAEPSKQDEQVIHVIPDKFYGATGKAIMKEPSATPPPAASAGSATPAAPKPESGKKKFPVLIVVIVLIVLLGGGGAAAYFLLFADKGQQCGDNTCDSSETYKTCPSDCQEPGPQCGDGACERPENYNTCPQDCEAPKPVCGDGTCEEDEDYKSCPGDCEAPEAECGNDICEEDLGETWKDCPGDCMPPEPNQASDTDSDGLTDDEENLIYKSDPNKSNSDGDSFVDLNEVLNMFDPANPDPAVLIDNPGITSYGNTAYGIEIYRPSSWTVREILSERAVHFTAPTGEVVEVTVFSKEEDQPLMQWYNSQPKTGTNGQVESGTNKKGYEQVISSNRRVIYVSDGTTVVMLDYKLVEELEIRYRVTLTMMANSLIISEPVSASAPTEGGETGTALPVSSESSESEAEEPPVE
jgi:hypothetical protein